MNNPLEITILANGRLQFNRSFGSKNKDLLEILRDVLSPEQYVQVEEFVQEADKIEVIKGDRILCG